MNDCECLEKCIFFNDKMENKPALANLFKKSYCKGDSSKCARHIVFEKFGAEAVPNDLFPNQIERAMEIIS